MRKRNRVLLAASVVTVASVTALALYALSAATDPTAGVGGIARETADFELPVEAGDLSTPAAPARPEFQAITIPTRPADPVRSDTPLVSPDMPVTEMLELLGDRARRGDAVAACELGRALLECRMQPMFDRMPSIPTPPKGAAREQVDRFVEHEARREEWRTRLDQRCSGLSNAARSEGIAFSARAALGGHVPSLLDFLNGPMMAPAEFIRDPQLGQLYRTQGWPLVQRALAERNYLVASMLFRQLSQWRASPLSVIVPERYQDADAARAMVQLLGGQLPPTAQQPAPSAEALATAEQWAAELFGGDLPEGTTSTGPAIMPLPDDDGARCRDPATWLESGR